VWLYLRMYVCMCVMRCFRLGVYDPTYDMQSSRSHAVLMIKVPLLHAHGYMYMCTCTCIGWMDGWMDECMYIYVCVHR
jgi:hypothetical protein